LKKTDGVMAWNFTAFMAHEVLKIRICQRSQIIHGFLGALRAGCSQNPAFSALSRKSQLSWGSQDQEVIKGESSFRSFSVSLQTSSDNTSTLKISDISTPITVNP
jgi:hypothetical protein